MRFPTNPSAPHFDPRAWTERPAPSQNDPEATEGMSLTGANCYQYALAGSNPDGTNRVFHEAIPHPGHLAGELYNIHTPEFTPQVLLELIRMDGLDTVEPVELTEQPGHYSVPSARPGYYLVGIYHKNITDIDGNQSRDFHLTRQDRDGGWSGKAGHSQTSEVARFLEPAEDGGYRPLPRFDGDMQRGDFYTFAGYAYVPERGIDAGLEHPIHSVLVHARDNKQSAEGVEAMLRAQAMAYRDGNENEKATIIDNIRRIGETIRMKYGDSIAQTFIDMADNQLDIIAPLPRNPAPQQSPEAARQTP
jgi:hypothetical protein